MRHASNVALVQPLNCNLACPRLQRQLSTHRLSIRRGRDPDVRRGDTLCNATASAYG